MAAAVAQRPMLLGEQHHGRRGKHRASAAASAESVTEATVGQLQALPEHGSLLFCQTRTQAEPQPLAGPARSESDHDNDTQALLRIECVDSHEEEHHDHPAGDKEVGGGGKRPEGGSHHEKHSMHKSKY